MTIRTTSKTVTFVRPFVLDGLDEVQPAGTYDVETDEELLDTVSIRAYRRVSTLVHLHALPSSPRVPRTVTIDPVELDAVLAEDAAQPPAC